MILIYEWWVSWCWKTKCWQQIGHFSVLRKMSDRSWNPLFYKGVWTLVKMDRRVLILWSRKGQSKQGGDCIERGVKKFFFDMSIFIWDLCYAFYKNKLSCYFCYSLNIASNNSKFRNQEAWLCWFSVICLTE